MDCPVVSPPPSAVLLLALKLKLDNPISVVLLLASTTICNAYGLLTTLASSIELITLVPSLSSTLSNALIKYSTKILLLFLLLVYVYVSCESLE